MIYRRRQVWAWIFLVFLLMFGPKFGTFVDVITITCIIVITVQVMSSAKIPKIGGVFLLIILYAIYILLILTLYNIYDQWHLFQPWRAAINYLGIMIVVGALARKGWNWRQILSMVSISIYIHSSIVILTFLFPDLGHAISEATGFVDKSYLRSSGLTNSYGITSLVTVIPFLIVPFTKGSLYRSKYDHIGLVIVFISLFLLARIGLYFLPIIIFSVLWRMLLHKRLRLTHLYSIFLIMGATYLLYWLGQIGIFRSESGSSNILINSLAVFFNESVHHSLEIVRTTLGGDSKIGSWETIGNFIYHNESSLEYFFGTGHYGRGNELYHLETDISYALLFSMSGFIGIGLMILIHIFPYFSYTKSSKKLRYIFLVLVVIILISHYKEATLLTRNLFSLWSFVAACLHIDHFQKKARNDDNKFNA
jgi:hypothetical protein